MIDTEREAFVQMQENVDIYMDYGTRDCVLYVPELEKLADSEFCAFTDPAQAKVH